MSKLKEIIQAVKTLEDKELLMVLLTVNNIYIKRLTEMSE
jgi:hypothetical protein